jgi:hypothetical protein
MREISKVMWLDFIIHFLLQIFFACICIHKENHGYTLVIQYSNYCYIYEVSLDMQQ